MRLARSTAVLVAAVLSLCAVTAHADSQLLHFKFARALAANPLDSTLVTLSQTSFDTTASVIVDDLNATAVAAIDTNVTAGTVTALGSISHAATNLWLVVEVTGLMQSTDSVYVGYQLSQGSMSTANGGSGDQNNPLNWRWYNGNLTAVGGLVANATGSQTFVYPMPCIPSGTTAWIQAKAIRFIIQGDNTSAAKGFSTRASLVSRNN